MSDSLIAARAVHFASTVLLAGTIIFGCWIADPVLRSAPVESIQDRFRRQLTSIAWIALGTAVASGAAWLVLLAAEIAGRPIAETLGGDVVWTLLTRTRFGADWSLRLALAIVLAGALAAFAHHGKTVVGWRGTLLVAMGVALLGSLAWAGHAAATPGFSGELHRAADVAHLVAVGAWVGGLLPLALLLAAARSAGDSAVAVAYNAARRFSTVGVMSVATILVTGIVNAWMLVGSVRALLETGYGRLLLAKVGLFLTMIAIAAFNRLQLTPRLASAMASADALRALRRNTLIEAACGLAILGIVGVLGTLPPGMYAHAHH